MTNAEAGDRVRPPEQFVEDVRAAEDVERWIVADAWGNVAEIQPVIGGRRGARMRIDRGALDVVEEVEA